MKWLVPGTYWVLNNTGQGIIKYPTLSPQMMGL